MTTPTPHEPSHDPIPNVRKASIEDDTFQQSSPESLKLPYKSTALNNVVSVLDKQSLATPPSQLYEDHDYNFSGVTDDEGNHLEEQQLEIHDVEGYQQNINLLNERYSDHLRRQSGRSSISSFPASVSHPLSTLGELRDRACTSPKSPSIREHRSPSSNSRGGSVIHNKLNSPRSYRDQDHFDSPFRHPSSVRAMQMRDEIFDDSDNHSPSSRHKRSRSCMSIYSQRSSTSTQTSPSKRGVRSSPRKNGGSKLKNEYPLVLLHCSLLSPALPLSIATENCSNLETLIKEILPEEYAKRWIMLQDRLIRNEEVKNRGVLISHPRDEYDLLEERLLESLELQRPRIRAHHYLQSDGTKGADSGFESAGSVGDEADDESTCAGGKVQCPDCGTKVAFGEEDVERKWEIKVYAANGLMRAGAWSAAWQEMEKIDVQIGVWLPESVRQEAEAKLIELEQQFRQTEQEAEAAQANTFSDYPTSREEEIYGDAGRAKTQEEIDGFAFTRAEHPHPSTTVHVDVPDYKQNQQSTGQTDLHILLVRYFQGVLQDRKNVVIVVLSMMVLFFSILPTGAPAHQAIKTAEKLAPLQEQLTTTFVATQTVTSMSTSIMTVTATSIETSLFTTTATVAEAHTHKVREVLASGVTDERPNYESEFGESVASHNDLPEVASDATGAPASLSILDELSVEI